MTKELVNLYDHTAVLNVLGSLIKNPNIFLDDNYQISEKDFAERFHIIIFSAIKNLFVNGVNVITPIEIDVYLTNYPTQYKVFEDNNGMMYIDNLIKFSKLENFDYNYNTLKKYTILRCCKSQGFSTKDFIDEKLVDPKEIQIMMDNFREFTLNDIVNKIEGKLIAIKEEFYHNKEVIEVKAGVKFNHILYSFSEAPIMGMPLNSGILNTVYAGARKKCLYLNSSPSGTFKTRSSIANCVKCSIPYFYDTEKREWVYTSFNQPSLFITTELDDEEISTMVMAYVSGVEEEKILNATCTKEETERILKANKYVEEANLYFVQLPNFTAEQLEQIIKKYVIQHGVTYVYFDYIFASMGMLKEIAAQTRGMAMRMDSMLLALMDKLKQLATTLDIHISTSTQVTANWKETKIADNSLIAACKSLADKADIASVTLPVRNEDLEIIAPYLEKGFYPKPNLCVNVYKVRRGKYNKIKVYLFFNGSTCRTTELFATDSDGELLEITSSTVQALLDRTQTEIKDLSEKEFEELEKCEQI